ncbi:zinc-binding dehydrogenase [Alicyclobacillus fastidiosus]|uniref:Alcohol dehydrogenase catalytic domain-containing protein n=1 Tax=Alicyclobacillus fastidiosus TaxID=392011 RepID=A0ABV5AA81_9BACL|nr:zinc-binding dehydrogenase [Alicyclobacillus fastidiosus]WEH10671.1 alcohol dehydrogenase catalytic domain-containing protein [Alicyclobacillus fastidiosus]
MKAVELIGSRECRVIDVPMPEVDAEEVLVKVSVCGVCASELHVWESGPGQQAGLVLGHEPMGVVYQVGENVRGFQAGDRVTGLFKRGFAEYTKANYKDLIKVPDELSDLEAIGEPLSCLVSGADRTPVGLGDVVAVVGTGFMGLGFLQLLRLKGAGHIIAVDIRKEGLDHARRFGADEVFFPDQVPDKYKVTEWSHIGRGVNVSVEAGGAAATLDLAAQMVSAHGVMSIVGYHQSNQGLRTMNMNMLNWKAVTILNAHERRDAVHLAAMRAIQRLMVNNRFNMRDMITHVYTLDQVDQAYSDLKGKPEGFIKAVVRMD